MNADAYELSTTSIHYVEWRIPNILSTESLQTADFPVGDLTFYLKLIRKLEVKNSSKEEFEIRLWERFSAHKIKHTMTTYIRGSYGDEHFSMTISIHESRITEGHLIWKVTRNELLDKYPYLKEVQEKTSDEPTVEFLTFICKIEINERPPYEVCIAEGPEIEDENENEASDDEEVESELSRDEEFDEVESDSEESEYETTEDEGEHGATRDKESELEAAEDKENKLEGAKDEISEDKETESERIATEREKRKRKAAEDGKNESVAAKHIKRKRKGKYDGPKYSCLNVLYEDFKKFLEDDSEKDVILMGHYNSFRAHRSILQARSMKLARRLQDTEVDEVQMKRICSKTLKNFLFFVYCGTLPQMTCSRTAHQHHMGIAYKVKDLPGTCLKFLKMDLNKTSVISILCSLGTLSNIVKDKKLESFIKENEEIFATETWKGFSHNHPEYAFDVYKSYFKSLPSPIKKPWSKPSN